jgi:hypothetical protein
MPPSAGWRLAKGTTTSTTHGDSSIWGERHGLVVGHGGDAEVRRKGKLAQSEEENFHAPFPRSALSGQDERGADHDEGSQRGAFVTIFLLPVAQDAPGA